MNYQGYAGYNYRPPYKYKPYDAHYDTGSGVPKLNKFNTTVQDIYRTPFLFIQEHRKNYNNMAPYALKGIQTKSPLSRIYFSDRNIRRLQRLIRREVYIRTKGVYKLDVDQDISKLFIVMRAIYLEYARNLPGQTVRQVKRLNRKVVDEVLPGIITEIKQYYGYLKEINKPLTPIPRPMNVNNAGRRTLPSITTTWGIY